MIISASYKTDIPTFYGVWFMNRLRAGYCKMVNPWNRNQVIRVSLALKDVDGIIFWTKNIAPFLPHLREVFARGYRFVIQHTINAYPRALEFAVVDASRSIQHLHEIAADRPHLQNAALVYARKHIGARFRPPLRGALDDFLDKLVGIDKRMALKRFGPAFASALNVRGHSAVTTKAPASETVTDQRLPFGE